MGKGDKRERRARGRVGETGEREGEGENMGKRETGKREERGGE